MNSDNIAYLSDGFSLRRAWMFGMTFRRQIIWQVRIAVILILGLSVINISSIYFSNALFKFSYYILSLVISFLMYLSSLIFASKDDTLTYLVPASIKEKFAFYAIYSAVLFPLFVQILYLVYWGVGSCLTDDINFRYYIASRIVNMPDGIDLDDFYKMIPMTSTIILNILVMASWSLTSLAVVLFSKFHRIIKAILTPFVCCIVIGIIGAVVGFVAGFRDAINHVEFYQPDSQEIMMTVMTGMYKYIPIADVFMVFVTLGIAVFVYQKMKKQRVE